MDLKLLIFQVFYTLMQGTVLSFGVLKESQAGKKFYRIHGIGAAVIALLSLLFIGRFTLSQEAIRLSGLSILFCFLYSLRLSQKSFFNTSLYALFLATTVLALRSFIAVFSWPALFNLSLSTLFLGVTMAAMLLGHWYLNQPKMSVDELKKLAWGYGILITVRFIYSCIGMWGLLSPMEEAEIYRYLLGKTEGIFLTMRFFWGILGPLFLFYFIWGTVKIRSTQSATGILYVAVVFVLIGEIISQYLAAFHRILF